MKKLGKLLAFALVLAMLAAPAMIAANAEGAMLYTGVRGGGGSFVTISPELSPGQTFPVSYAAGTVITATATVSAGYRFTGWSAEGVTLSSNSANPVTFTMPADTVTLIAIMESTSSDYIYSSISQRYTTWLRTPLNGFFYICLFGWLWMPHVDPPSFWPG